MKKNILLFAFILLMTSCRNEKQAPASTVTSADDKAPAGYVVVGKNIVTEIILKPDPEGDPWEAEKVAGYMGQAMVDGVFTSIYKGTLKATDYHSGEILGPDDIRNFEKEFNNDRSKIGKLSFTEDWFYNPSDNSILKKVRSVSFGYEMLNNEGKVFGYKAVFKADLPR